MQWLVLGDFSVMRRRASQRGAVLAEFAIVSLALLLMIFGIIECGRALYTYHLVSDVARAASRYAIVNGSTACTGGSPDPLQTYARSQAPVAGTSQLAISTTCTASSYSACTGTAAPYSGCNVNVTVSYPFAFLVQLPGMPATLGISSTSTMVISQ